MQISGCCRYEELKRQLEAAQEAAQQEDEEAELARATAAVARLTAPSAAVATADADAAEEFAVAASRNGRKPPSRKVMDPDPLHTGTEIAAFDLLYIYKSKPTSFRYEINYMLMSRPD